MRHSSRTAGWRDDVSTRRTRRRPEPRQPPPGRGDAPPLLLHGHVDVVTTAGQDWTHPPFEARLEDGDVWGRGALDMKGGVAMLVPAFLRPAREHERLPGDLVLAVLCDEETGGDFGARFLVDEHPELFEGMRYALGEFGGSPLDLGGKRFYPIQVAEKQICWLKATRPRRRAATARCEPRRHVARLGKLLVRRSTAQAARARDARRARWFERSRAELPRKEALVLRVAADAALPDTARACSGPRALRLLEPRCATPSTPPIVRGGSKINVVPPIELELDGRALPGLGPDELIAEVRARRPRRRARARPPRSRRRRSPTSGSSTRWRE